MQLIYRGVDYSSSKKIASIDCNHSLKYRGQPYYHRRKHLCIAPKEYLTYRGVPYFSSELTNFNRLTIN